MQREQERERRRIRDRQRRQSMTQEQRERHLARRRRNYQLRRQRAANANVHAPFIPPLPNPHGVELSAGEASTSDELQGVTSSTSLDYRVLCHGIGLPHHGLNQGQETLNLGTKLNEGSSSIHMETLAYKSANFPTRLRLNHVRHLARNRTSLMVDLDPADTHQVAAELIIKEDVSVGDFGSKPKSMRLNCVKRLARSIKSPPKETAEQKDHNLLPEGIQLLGNESFIASS
ncbi:hypothetical protein SESBI_08770 [Sesbania bispinosa]|nr:hypothetical protein SESBI_08770 [Sesbania bispinosa]